jgi:UMF1 family MFS transporter
MASTVIHWGCFSQTIGIFILMLEVPLFAGVGNVIADKLQKKYNLSNKKVIIICLCWVAVIPVWGMLGWATEAFGIRKGWEILALGPIYGLPLGAMQSYSRSLFATLTPKGMVVVFDPHFFA